MNYRPKAERIPTPRISAGMKKFWKNNPEKKEAARLKRLATWDAKRKAYFESLETSKN